MNSRIFHYRIALFFAIFITISAVTGLLWAYAPHLYLQPGYMEKHVAAPPINLNLIQVNPSQIPSLISPKYTSEIAGIELKSEAGFYLYDVLLKSKERLLIDAQTGALLSPLSEELASTFAKQYVPSDVAVAAIDNVKDWVNRKGNIFKNVWVVKFADERSTEIVLNADNGAIIEDSDAARRVHFIIMKLHQFSFFGTHQELTAISGIPLLLLILSGSLLSWKRLRAKKSSKK